MRNEHREIRQALPAGHLHRHSVGGRGGFKANAEEDHFPIRRLTGDLDGVQGRINHAHIRAFALNAEEVLVAARHAEHVAERAKDHTRPSGDGERLID